MPQDTFPEIPPDFDDDGMPVFVIGLAMAGAISAGAYTAGVVDYLFRAMRAHNRRAGTPGGPTHKVLVKAISGTSAGGTTAGLIVASLLDAGGEESPAWEQPKTGIVPVSGGGTASFGYVLGPVYDVWVRDLRFYDRGSDTGLLAETDLGSDAPVLIDRTSLAPEKDLPLLSLLNGSYLDTVATGAIDGISAWTEANAGYSFVSGALDLFLTTTAMNGVSNQIGFGGEQKFNMTQHSLVRHFRIPRLGSGAELASPWLEDWDDVGIALDPETSVGGKIPFSDPDYTGDWKKFTVASIATGAFPFALPARYILSVAAELGAKSSTEPRRGGALPVDIINGGAIPEIFPRDVAPGSPAPYVAVDGGTINNEPFEYARFAIRKRGANPNQLRENPRGRSDANRAVIMIDPFPDMEKYMPLQPDAATKLSGLLAIGSKLLSVVIAQARFKPTELLLASDSDIHSRFIISPVRKAPDGTYLTGGNAMACGSLNGFGGFLDESFRKHDFLLGQRNCRKFLAEHFTLDPANPVMGGGPSQAIIDPGEMPDIPDPAWPGIGDAALKPIFAKGQSRLTKVVNRLIDLTPLNATARKFGKWLWIPVWRGGITGSIQGIVASDLLLRGLYGNPDLEQKMRKADLLGGKDPQAEFEAARAVTIALMQRGTKYATADELLNQLRTARNEATVLQTLPDRQRLEDYLDGLAEAGLADRRRIPEVFPFRLRKEYRYDFPS
ncbi:hypothetical protein [Mangrovicoccus sp. HB161399]|uniref:hypothetical protein n=1 Tax=Mangrovicoccus sp. HB161399 TaxID=2720392 RepID=UPI001555EB98|nr:hypothetical protein [Mangrovicoccus sp. HB161399]